MRQSHLIAYNAIIIWGTTILQLIPQLILVPFLIRNIGESGYGEYALIWSLIMAIEQLEMSVQSGVIKYSAAYLAENRIGDVNKILSSSYIFSLFLGFLSCLFISVIAFFKFGGSREMAFSLIVVGIMMLFLIQTTPYQGILMAKQRHYIRALSGIISQYGGLLLVILWFRLVRPSVSALIIITVGAILLSRLAQIPFAYHLVPGLRNYPRSFNWKTFLMVVYFGLMIVLSALTNVINTTGIRWLSGALVSTSFVAHLVIFLMPGMLLSQIVLAMTITIMPAASAYQATQNLPMLRELFLKATRYIVLLVMASLLVAILLIQGVLRLWVGPHYEFLGLYAFINLGGVAVLVSASCAHHILKGFGELRRVLFAFVIGNVLIPITVLLVIFSIWGSPYIAVSVGLALGNVVAGIIQIRFCTKVIQANYKELIVQAYIQPIAAGGVSLAVAFGMIALIGLKGFEFRAAIAVLAVFLLFGGFYFFLASPNERRQFRGFCQMVRGRCFVFMRRGFPSVGDHDV